MTRANFYKMHDAYFKAHDELERVTNGEFSIWSYRKQGQNGNPSVNQITLTNNRTGKETEIACFPDNLSSYQFFTAFMKAIQAFA